MIQVGGGAEEPEAVNLPSAFEGFEAAVVRSLLMG
jgi:hypothetical protein